MHFELKNRGQAGETLDLVWTTGSYTSRTSYSRLDAAAAQTRIRQINDEKSQKFVVHQDLETKLLGTWTLTSYADYDWGMHANVVKPAADLPRYKEMPVSVTGAATPVLEYNLKSLAFALSGSEIKEIQLDEGLLRTSVQVSGKNGGEIWFATRTSNADAAHPVIANDSYTRGFQVSFSNADKMTLSHSWSYTDSAGKKVDILEQYQYVRAH